MAAFTQANTLPYTKVIGKVQPAHTIEKHSAAVLMGNQCDQIGRFFKVTWHQIFSQK